MWRIQSLGYREEFNIFLSILCLFLLSWRGIKSIAKMDGGHCRIWLSLTTQDVCCWFLCEEVDPWDWVRGAYVEVTWTRIHVLPGIRDVEWVSFSICSPDCWNGYHTEMGITASMSIDRWVNNDDRTIRFSWTAEKQKEEKRDASSSVNWLHINQSMPPTTRPQ